MTAVRAALSADLPHSSFPLHGRPPSEISSRLQTKLQFESPGLREPPAIVRVHDFGYKNKSRKNKIGNLESDSVDLCILFLELDSYLIL